MILAPEDEILGVLVPDSIRSWTPYSEDGISRLQTTFWGKTAWVYLRKGVNRLDENKSGEHGRNVISFYGDLPDCAVPK